LKEINILDRVKESSFLNERRKFMVLVAMMPRERIFSLTFLK
jgi:hypothetical protein